MIRIDELAQQLSDAVFRGGMVPNSCEIFTTPMGLRGIRVGDVELVEQNPNTKSRFAQLACDGTEILWAFFGGHYWIQNGKTKGIINGEWKKDMHNG